jgi:3-phenylpropionate/trans-cinnamate dioxygenase ferredoxin subunit
MPRYVIAPVDALPPGERIVTVIAGRSIGVFNVDGEFYAVRNRCPHKGAELCRGRVVLPSPLSSAPGEFITQSGPPWLQCPWHGWEFDLRSGQSWIDPTSLRVRAYSVAVENGEAVDGADPSKLVRGPFVADTYTVEVEADYIVVDMSSS